jgi:hypothetical protein
MSNTLQTTTKTNNIFEQVLTNAQGVQDKLLGPNYPYYNNIKTPSQIGMSDRGTLSALGNDVNGLINYVKVLVDGKGIASSTGQPLGNKFFLKTGAKCLDTNNNQQVDRYIYIDNVPDGSIPFISQAMGVNFSDFRGLIPGAISNLNVLNPYTIMQSFLTGSTPPCQKLTMQTIDVNNNKSSETHYVTLIDIQNMNPCTFNNGKNPINGKVCKQAFNTMYQNQEVIENEGIEQIKLPQDPITQLYFLSLSALAIYIFYRLMEKSK